MRWVFIVKTRKKTCNITINAGWVDINERQWQCSNAMMGAVQPTGQYWQFQQHLTTPNNIFDEGWQGGEEGRGLRRSNLPVTEGVDGDTGVVTTRRCLLFDT
jgi:hypothetical protein